jgi:hypothetical protein
VHPRRNLTAEYEHPRFDVPTWWHLEAVRGLSDGERRLMRFYAWLSARVDRTQEDTVPRKEWLNRCFAEWLAETKSPGGDDGGHERLQQFFARVDEAARSAPGDTSALQAGADEARQARRRA